MAGIDISKNTIGSTRLQRLPGKDLTEAQHLVFQDIESMTEYLVSNSIMTAEYAKKLSKNDLANAIRIEIDAGRFVE